MKVRDDQMCSYCNDVVDYIQHFFFDCPTIKKFWNYIEQYILITFDIQTHLTVVKWCAWQQQQKKATENGHVLLVIFFPKTPSPTEE